MEKKAYTASFTSSQKTKTHTPCAKNIHITLCPLFGAYAIKDDAKRGKIIDKLARAIERMEVLCFRYNDAILAAKIAGELARKGKRVGADAVIAAIAINHGCNAIVTKNDIHFKWIEEITGLKVETY